ncbi:RNA-processing [Abeliophyllum distichum]|uniref:RNA-processing n=1 Tax=Abeliophyllum distichum TaxID=126358 RepID=A0ABD1U3E1_9LAMI
MAKNLRWAAYYPLKPLLKKNSKPNSLTLDRKIQDGVKSGPGSKRNIRLLKANYVKEFAFMVQGEDPLDPNKCFLDLNTLQAREDSAIRQAEAEAERIGVGVSAEGQSIFDALAKTLPVHWDKTTIVVMNEVRVSPPYLPESVKGGTPSANDRVRKVLELERKRLQARTADQ